MYGLIVGDIIGSTFELENHRSKFFEYFRKDARFTDDTVISSAVAYILNNNIIHQSNDEIAHAFRIYCLHYLNRGYGSLFYQWLVNGLNRPYESYGNGSLVRVPSIFKYATKNNLTIDEAKNFINKIVSITHNHEESILYSNMYFEILYLLRKDTINYVEKILHVLNKYNIVLEKKIEDYRSEGLNDISAKGTLLRSLSAITEADSFNESIENIISIGGDSDTYAAIVGTIAEVIWGIPEDYLKETKKYFRKEDYFLLEEIEKLY